MDAIKLLAEVNEEGQLIVDLPSNVPVGLVDLLILPKATTSVDVAKAKPTARYLHWLEQRERMQVKLSQAQHRQPIYHAVEGYVPLSDEERMRLVILPLGTNPTDTLIDEDRGVL